MPKKYTFEQIRDLIYSIRKKSKVRVTFKEISKRCGWSDSRVVQLLSNFDKYFPKKEFYQDDIYEKLTECLESPHRINQPGEPNVQ